jgi:hypothetical protein
MWIKRFCLAILLAICFAFSAFAMADEPTPFSQERLDYFHSHLVHDLNDFKARLDTPKADATVRTYTYAAYHALAIGMDPKMAEDFIRRAMARQDMNPASTNYGNVPWQMFENTMSDANSIEFTFSSIGPILLGYGDKLSPEFRKELVPHVAAAIEAMYRHKVPVSYSNIYLMKTENLLLLGEAIKDSKAIAAGREQLDTWLDYTRTHGIHEFDSPTYASVQIYCAENGYRHTGLADVKAKLKTACDYLWADAAANYFDPAGMMAGAHSRDYDFLRATGPIERVYYIEGLRHTPAPDDLFVDSYGAYMNALENGYRPSPKILSLAHDHLRIVKQTWDTTPGADRYTYITPDFAMGSTSAHYGPQNREIGIDLGDGGPYVPVSVSVSGDILDSPYGNLRQVDRSGHLKPNRLWTDLACVQDRGMLLGLLNLRPDQAKTPVQCVATEIVLPLQATSLFLDGQMVKFPSEALAAEAAVIAKQKISKQDERAWDAWSMPAHNDSVLGLRYAGAGVAIQIFAADGVEDQTPTYALKCDGADLGAGRLVVYHYRGEAKEIQQKVVRAGIMILCDHCDGDADLLQLMKRLKEAPIKQSTSGDVWTVGAKILGAKPETLGAALDFKTGQPAMREVNEQPFQPELFSVNGLDINKQIFGSGGRN